MTAPVSTFAGRLGRLVKLGAVLGGGYLGIQWLYERQKEERRRPLAETLSMEERSRALEWRPPSRQQLMNRLKGIDAEGGIMTPTEAEFDLVVIGGGATGTGCALDGARRGLKVALVERDDFSSGTSSKSTKLVHGGVRYLEKAILGLDWEQFAMVYEALAERATFLRVAPHLTTELPIMIPVYKYWQIPYFWLGSKAYDLVAGGQGLEASYFMGRSQSLAAFPLLRRDSLVGAMVYYDGAQNDARTNVALALTAIYHGATATNYTEVIGLLKEEVVGFETPQIRGVLVRDRLSGDVFPVRCKGVLSATGPFCDTIRKMDDPACRALVQPSVGTHIVFPAYFSPRSMGLIDPMTSDGRVIFFLPWEGNTVAGTTDAPSPLTFEPRATGAEVDFIVEEVRKYLDTTVAVQSSDVLAAWAGLRPLIRNPDAISTQELVRNHLVLQSPSGLVTIAGGKWTTYRKMAEDAIDAAIRLFSLQPTRPDCCTASTPLIGSHGFRQNDYIRLIQIFGIETDVAKHLCSSYGDRAALVLALSPAPDAERRWPLCGRRLASQYPYLEGEVIYAVRFEYAQTAVDVLARRTRLAHLSCQAARDALPRVLDLMAEELCWSPLERERQRRLAEEYLITCGIRDLHLSRARFTATNLEKYRALFLDLLPDDQKHLWGRLTLTQAYNGWRSLLPSATDQSSIDWRALIEKVDIHQVDSIGLAEFLDGISIILGTPHQ